VSLIGDALRKARQEAAERDSERRGVLFSAKIADAPGRSNLGLGLALGALIAVAATITGGAVVWWLLGGGSSPETAGTVALQDAPVEAIRSEEPASESVSETVTEADAGDRARDRDSGGGSTQRQEQPPEVATEEAESSGVAFPDAVDPGADSVPAAAAAESGGTDSATAPDGVESGFAGIEDGEEVYILEADLGNVVLSLDYLVFRTDDPFAEINGVEVHLGGVVDGFRVKDIQKDRVRLSDGRRNIVLRAP